jgi:hypothetical protein
MIILIFLKKKINILQIKNINNIIMSSTKIYIVKRFNKVLNKNIFLDVVNMNIYIFKVM